MNSTVRKGIALIVVDNDNFLLLKHKKNNLWGFISGGIEPGEDPVSAVARETMEEAGVKIDESRLSFTGKTISFVSSKGPGEQKVFLYQIDKPWDIKIDNEEIFEFGWFDLKSAKEVLKPKQVLIETLSDIFSN
jgi:8-oxo-dGTP pyrophosphatase MutT (NUDIX family)